MPRVFVCLVALSMLVGGPKRAFAQDGPSLGNGGEVGSALSAGVGITWLGSRPLPVYSIAATLRLSPTVELGGEGVVGLRKVRLPPRGSPERPELTSSYGGILMRWRPAGDAPGIRWGGSVLIGAGTARVRSSLAGTAASENHFVLEPRLNAATWQDRALRLSARAGYRIALGAGALPGVGLTDLRGPTVSLVGQVVFGP